MTTVPNALTFSNAYLPLRQRNALASPRQEAVKENAIEIVDSFQKKSSEKSSVPTKVIVKEVPVADKTSVVLATMGFIASLGAVFGVGLLYSKMNRPNEEALHEVQTLLAPLEKKLDKLEKQLKNKAGDVELETAFSEMRRLLLEAKDELRWLNMRSDLQFQRVNQLNEKVTKISESVDYMKATFEAINHAHRRDYENTIRVAGFHGGKEGFIPAYMEENDVRGTELASRLTEIKRSEIDRHTLLKMHDKSIKEMPYQPLVNLFLELKDKDKQNPAVLRIVLNEIGSISWKLLSTLSDSDAKQNEKNFLTVAKEEIAFFVKALDYYENTNQTFTPEELAIIRQKEDLNSWVECVEYCKKHHFSLAQETGSFMVQLENTIKNLHEGRFPEASAE